MGNVRLLAFLALVLLGEGIHKHMVVQPIGLPHQGRIAVVARGQSFRGQYDECNESATGDQMLATRSLLEKVVAPLERHGNQVDMFLANSNNCKLGSMLLQEIGDRPVKQLLNFESSDQAEGMQKALASFEATLSRASVQEVYDQIIVVRHDLVFVATLEEWRADFSQLNIGAWLCMPDNKVYGDSCRCDWFYTMPGNLYSAFSRAIGEPSCFNPYWCHGCGHGCLPHMDKNAAGQVSTIFNEPSEMMKGLNKSNAKFIYLYGPDTNQFKS